MRFSAILSSVRPFCDDGYTACQQKAIASWEQVCDKVVLFNKPEEAGGLIPAVFVESSSPPNIKEMLQWAHDNIPEDGVIAIVNSDIVLSRWILRCIEIANKRNLNMGWAATSRRWEEGVNGHELKGWGLDIFILTPRIITHILRDVPDYMTIGRVLWDNWLNGWLRAHIRSSHYFDITSWKCVFHPNHERPNGRVGGDFTQYTDEQVKAIYSRGNISCGGMPPTIYS